METTDRLVIAFAGAGVAFFVAVRLWTWWKARRQSLWNAGPPAPAAAHASEKNGLEALCRDVAPGFPACAVEGGGLRFFHRGIRGRLDFISDRTEIQLQTGDLVRQVVEVLPIGFPLSFLSGERGRLRARGSRSEYERIFKNRAEEQVLLEVGIPYELRLCPDGVTLRLDALPETARILGYWLACAFRIVDLLPGVDLVSSIEVTAVANEVAGETLCQVCGASLADAPVVRCATCSTPHHEDCWLYARKCSTFGCDSRRCVR